MINPIKDIYNWQKAAGNLDKPYDDFLESSFQIEEALEGFYLDSILSILENSHPNYSQSPHYGKTTAKDVSRAIVTHCIEPIDGRNMEDLTNVDRLDKACDAIVYAIGSIAKLGLDHHGITKALNIVNNANKAKLGMARDKHGKLLKPANYTGPEAELAKLLSETRR